MLSLIQSHKQQVKRQVEEESTVQGYSNETTIKQHYAKGPARTDAGYLTVPSSVIALSLFFQGIISTKCNA